ncbi:MAG TPA: hypothetical protein ENG83_11700 [Nitrospirae bacterium]|nr:hypothetical protein BMS3Abin06_02391 [bacterium BMS3Abin06]HDH12838.1 hypothetical protein [Nitrospirota bacterium]HDZ01615.1 hypothetical protein [Nitrospirota bacterium]
MRKNKSRIACLILLLLFIFPLPVSAGLSSFNINGYVKYLFSSSKTPAVDERLNANLIHARLNAQWYPSEALRAGLGLRMRAYYGNLIEKTPDFLTQIKNHYEYGRLDAVLWDREKSVGYAQIDRLWLDYSKGNIETTIGRQRIAWGTALVWNVIDLFNPQSILDFDYEEKPGVDALRIQYYTGAVSKIELSAKPAKNRDKTITAGLFSVNYSGYDFYGIAGERNNRRVLGGAWAGAIAKAGFRGEFLISEAPDKSAPAMLPDLSDFGTSFFKYDKPTASAVLSADYTFSNSFYIHTEALYNSIGKTRNAGVFYQEALQAGLLSPSRWSIFQEFSYDITPLLRGSIFAIFNPDDGSSLIVPRFRWSITANLDFTLIAFSAHGAHFTEWGDYGNSVFTRFKYSF